MDFYTNVRKLNDKLAMDLEEHNLLHVFSTEKYPLTLTVRQNQAPDAQMEIYSTTDGMVSSQDAVLRLIFKLDTLEIQTDNRLVISDDLMSKIKNTGKKLRDAYCQAYFAERRNPESVELYGDPDENDADDGEDAFAGFYDGDEEEEKKDGAGE